MELIKGLGSVHGSYKTACLNEFIQEVTLSVIATETKSKTSILYYDGLEFTIKYASIN